MLTVVRYCDKRRKNCRQDPLLAQIEHHALQATKTPSPADGTDTNTPTPKRQQSATPGP